MKHLFVFLILAILFSFAPIRIFAAPIISSVSPGTATANQPVTLTAAVSAPGLSIKSCNLYIDSDDKGAMTVSGGTASKSYTFAAAQIYTAFVFCRDTSGGFSSGPNSSIWAKAPAGGGDTTPPTIGAVSPTTATAGSPTVLSASVSDSGGIASCRLFVSGENKGAMAITGNMASVSHTFPSSGAYSVYAECTDSANNTGSGSSAAINVSATQPPTNNNQQATTTGPAPEILVVSSILIKLECPTEAVAADHLCKAIYYVSKSGKRHAFPNEKVYFTWYADFDSVTTVTAAEMAGYGLGKNVTYRPGLKMVKFTTVPQVYAVAKGGILRWIKTEQDAVALYGADWNKKIDDISDAMFTSYAYGADISAESLFDPAGETYEAKIIDDTL